MKISPCLLDTTCHDCPASIHQFPPSDAPVKGNCGDEHLQGGCYGILVYRVKNPDLYLRQAVAAAARRAI